MVFPKSLALHLAVKTYALTTFSPGVSPLKWSKFRHIPSLHACSDQPSRPIVKFLQSLRVQWDLPTAASTSWCFQLSVGSFHSSSSSLTLANHQITQGTDHVTPKSWQRKDVPPKSHNCLIDPNCASVTSVTLTHHWCLSPPTHPFHLLHSIGVVRGPGAAILHRHLYRCKKKKKI